MAFVYILQSETTGRYYVGSTNDARLYGIYRGWREQCDRQETLTSRSASRRVDSLLGLVGVVRDQNVHFGVGPPSQNDFKRIAAHNLDFRLSISRVTCRNNSLAVQKHLIVAHFVGAATVSIGDYQNTTTIRRGIYPKVVCQSTRCIERTWIEEPHVDAGRIARVPWG